MQVYSWIYNGVEPKLIHVEFHSRFQIPSFSILGLPGPEIQEARERIIAAFHGSGIEFPKRRIIINLAPASIKKWGTGHDLAIAIVILQQALDLKWPSHVLAWGELGLQGEVKPRGQMAALVDLLLQHSVHTLILPPADAAHFIELVCWRREQGLPLPQIQNLIQLQHLRDVRKALQNSSPVEWGPSHLIPPSEMDASQLMTLPPSLERIIEIALTGRHHLLLLGPKGIGKSQSLEWLKALTPKPHPSLSWLRALRDPTQSPETLHTSPVRQVHSQIRPAHLLGSWRSHQLESGELALAHGGVLIADEFLEWPRDARECLREPLQNKRFFLSRVAGKVSVDCDFQFVGTGNLCPCGGLPAQFYGFTPLPAERLKKWRCRCRPQEVDQYLAKLSGPIADRIDLVTILYDLPDSRQPVRPLAEYTRRIADQRQFALDRWKCLPSQLSPIWIEKHLPRSSKIIRLMDRMPSLRSRHKTARIAYSLQCMEQSSEIREEHLFEASTFRMMD